MKPNLKEVLDSLYEKFGTEYLSTDPLWFPHQYENPSDIETVAFISATFAYGNVTQIKKTLGLVLDCLGKKPSETIKNGNFHNLFSGFKHRFHDQYDLLSLLTAIKETIGIEGSLERLFASKTNVSLQVKLSAFASILTQRAGKNRGKYFINLLPDSLRGSACKRLLMFLRWVVRKGPVDLGLWNALNPSELLIPLDTHITKISYAIGLSRSPSPSWKRAEEITSCLRRFCPEDPVRYDFALTRLGILKSCKGRFVENLCPKCPLNPFCRYYKT